MTRRTNSSPKPSDVARHLDEPIPAPEDPGDALRKGYSADPLPERPVPPQGPVPLAPDKDVHGHVQPRDEAAVLPPTGRSERESAPGNERVMGSDR